MLIADLSLTIVPATGLYASPVSDSNITASEASIDGSASKAIVLDFNAGDGLYARDLGTTFSWPTSTRRKLKVWQPSLIEMPENVYNRPTDWADGGTPGAKFIQGVLVEADSFNATKVFQLQSADDLSLHSLVEVGAGIAFNKQNIKAFSCVPFVAHSARLVSTDGVPWRVWQWSLAFQPYPELTQNWTTEATSLGLTGYGHIREINLAHLSTANLTLTLTFDQGNPIVITVAHSNGLQKKDKITIPVNKFKLVSFTITSTAKFRIWARDLEVKIGQWGRGDNYTVLKPFGGPSAPGAEV